MWRSYFRVFLRNLVQQKTIAVVNILGLALGLCAFLIIGVYVRDEYSYESRWQNADRIVRLVNIVTFTDTEASLSNVTELAGPRLTQFFPDEIETSARIIAMASTVRVGDEMFEETLFHADKELIDIFDFEVVEGSLQEALAAPNRIALSEESARQIFGEQPALGRLLTWEIPEAGNVSYEVAAVYRLPPGKGKLEFENFSLLDENGRAEAQAPENWFGGANSYFLLREGINAAALAPRLDDFVNQQVTIPVPEGSATTDQFKYRFQPIRDIYFNPNTDEDGGSQVIVNTFGVIAFLVLIIGWSNFVILALARSVERQREVGIRKTAGATGRYLLAQFAGEALLLASIALVVALALVEITLPIFAALMQTTLSIDLTESRTLVALAVLLLVTGNIGGFYPALVLARQKPELVLKPGGQSGTLGTGILRKILVSFQFLIATMLIIATLVLYLQLSYLRQRDPGFEIANVVTLALGDVTTSSEVGVLRDTIAKIPGVEHVSLASHEANKPGNLFVRDLRRNGDESSRVEITFYQVDYDFFTIYDMALLAGRVYNNELDGASQAAMATLPNPRLQNEGNGRIVLNETAIRALGFANPTDAVGAVIEERRRGPDRSVAYHALEIIGVVADNQFGSLRSVPGNEAYSLQSLASWYLTVKVTESTMPGIVVELQRSWQNVRPFAEAEIGFAETNVQQEFTKELNEGRLLSGFALLAIVVACMGLYGLVTFEARRRTREIGIRNVFGGEFASILKLFLTEFARPVFWTNALAWPLALWVMLRWLQRFPYQIDNFWLLPICVAAGLLVMSIVALTVGVTVAKAVEVKPVLSLRYE